MWAGPRSGSRLSLARAALLCDALVTLGVRARPLLAGHGDRCVSVTSTRRFRARPDMVAFEATGWESDRSLGMR